MRGNTVQGIFLSVWRIYARMTDAYCGTWGHDALGVQQFIPTPTPSPPPTVLLPPPSSLTLLHWFSFCHKAGRSYSNTHVCEFVRPSMRTCVCVCVYVWAPARACMMYDTDHWNQCCTHLNSLWCVCVWGGGGGVFPYGALCGLFSVGLCSTCVFNIIFRLICIIWALRALMSAW